MNEQTPVAPASTKKAKAIARDEAPACGVIMPISPTANHSEEHWRSVQTLLHRGITAAGFSPRNVWESVTSDRISERIIGNIFEVPIAVADISDLNPNVMLELGLRLASKKPTVVIANAGGDIPFDIRDFHATFYPSDMNMLGMEEFFRKLAKVLQDKHAASTSESYTPFLGKVIVDVASPETREVGVNEFLLSKLDEISARLSSVEGSVRRPRPSLARPTPARDIRGTLSVEIPEDKVDDFIIDTVDHFEIDKVEHLEVDAGIRTLRVHFSGATSHKAIWDVLSGLAEKHGGEMSVPF